MKTRVLLLFASLFILCATYYALHGNCKFFAPRGFLNINPSEIGSLVIFFEEKSYGFVKKNHKWLLFEPYEKNIDLQSFDRFLKDLAMLPVTQRISNNSDDSAMFGLRPPEIRINITYGPEKKDMWVFLGKDNEAKTSTYAKIKESDEIVLLGKVLKDDIAQIVAMIDAEDNNG